MVARSIDSARRGIPRVHDYPRQPAGAHSGELQPGEVQSREIQPPVRQSLRPRLTVIAPSLAEAVERVGGWIVDQSLAGWDVAVVTADRCDDRPLRILGAHGHYLESALAAPLAGPCLEAVALRTDLYIGDERIRRLVQRASDANNADIRLWGDAWPDDFDDRSDPVSHRLSLAACAFKAQAVRAALGGRGAGGRAQSGQARQPGRTEVLRRGAIRRPVLAAAR